MKISTSLSKCLQIFSILVVGSIFILNFFYNSTVSYDAQEKILIEPHFVKSIIFVIFAAIIFTVFPFKKNLEKIKEKHLFLILTAVFTLMAIYLICNVDYSIRADALETTNYAKKFLSGDKTVFAKGSYLYIYPHQIGLMLYKALLHFFFEDNTIIFSTNFLLVLGINFFTYKISDLIFANRLTNNITILLSFLFLPQFFFILFAYGTIPGLFFTILSIYYTLKFSKNLHYRDLILTIISGSIAVILRKNFLICIIAIVIFLCLDLFKKFSFKHLILIVSLVIFTIIPLKTLQSYFVNESKGVPSTLWIAMGTDIDNDCHGPGWYDGTSYSIFVSEDYNSEKAFQIAIQKIKNNLQKMKNDPASAAKFFYKKIISQWTDPVFQSVWSGPLEDCNQYTKTPFLKSIFNGGFAEDMLSNAMKLYMIIFWGLASIFILKYQNKYHGWQLVFLIVVGGFVFHIFWEAKSQYIYPYFFSIVPFAAFSLSQVFDNLDSLKKRFLTKNGVLCRFKNKQL